MNIKKISYLLLNFIMLLTLGFSLMIYTSLHKGLPWYDGCGMQFLIILILLVPVLLGVGFGFIMLNRIYSISGFNKRLPFYCLVGILLPILIDGSLSIIMTTTGTFLSIIFILMTIYTSISHIKKESLTGEKR